MKRIWDERIVIGSVLERQAYNGRIDQKCIRIELTAKAYLDLSLGHTVLDLSITPLYRYDDEPFPWYLKFARSTADDLKDHEAATRWVIGQIDRYADLVRWLIPPPDERSDDEILAAAHK
jgi:hypothetical protein